MTWLSEEKTFASKMSRQEQLRRSLRRLRNIRHRVRRALDREVHSLRNIFTSYHLCVDQELSQIENYLRREESHRRRDRRRTPPRRANSERGEEWPDLLGEWRALPPPEPRRQGERPFQPEERREERVRAPLRNEGPLQVELPQERGEELYPVDLPPLELRREEETRNERPLHPGEMREDRGLPPFEIRNDRPPQVAFPHPRGEEIPQLNLPPLELRGEEETRKERLLPLGEMREEGGLPPLELRNEGPLPVDFPQLRGEEVLLPPLDLGSLDETRYERALQLEETSGESAIPPLEILLQETRRASSLPEGGEEERREREGEETSRGTRREEEEEEEECVICHEKLCDVGQAFLKKCRHRIFHLKCILMVYPRLCPLCRQSFRQSDVISIGYTELKNLKSYPNSLPITGHKLCNAVKGIFVRINNEVYKAKLPDLVSVRQGSIATKITVADDNGQRVLKMVFQKPLERTIGLILECIEEVGQRERIPPSIKDYKKHFKRVCREVLMKRGFVDIVKLSGKVLD